MSSIYVYNLAVFILISLCYLYQVYYLYVGFRHRPEKYKAKEMHRFAVISCGRNERAVIGQLIESLHAQDYPMDLVDIYVVADNCTDDTAEVARRAGAVVYERFNKVQVGKSYALDYALKLIMTEQCSKNYDAIIVFDADNLVDPHFISAMNAAYDSGEQIATSYRNTKNFGSSWVSSAASLWFLREARFISAARSHLNTSCLIGGTGFMVSMDVIKENGGWPYNTMTEDIEFSVSAISKGYKIAYVEEAVIYDEQPTTLSASWAQRLRWSQGFYQVAWRYGFCLLKGACKGVNTRQTRTCKLTGLRVSPDKTRRFACYDAFFTVAPAMLLTVLTVVVNAGYLLAVLFGMDAGQTNLDLATRSLLFAFLNTMIVFFVLGIITLIHERKNIAATKGELVKAAFAFPFFMLTYLPIGVQAIFAPMEWKPIKHEVISSIDEVITQPR